MKLVL